MGFEPHQPWSRMESINEFKDRMTDTLDEAKAALAKSKDDMITTTGNEPQLWSSRRAIWSSLMLATFRPLDLHVSFLTGDWDHSQLTVTLVTVRTSSAFLRRWVGFIPSSMWSNYLWLLLTPFLADGQIRLRFQKS